MKYRFKLVTKDPMKVMTVLFAVLTIGLFIGASNTIPVHNIMIKILSIIYLAFSVSFLYFREYHVKNIILVRKNFDNKVSKKTIKKEYTGSDYRKVYHKRSCRFADSIKTENLEESNDISYFTKKKYKPCGICHPGKK